MYKKIRICFNNKNQMKRIFTSILVALTTVTTAMTQNLGSYAGLVLNEINGNDKFIELYNYGDGTISLKGMYIEKDGKNVWKAADITLNSGEFLLLYSEDVLLDHPDYEDSLIFSSGLSAKKAVRVQLFTPAGNSLDDFNLVNYTTPAPASYSRYPDGTGDWMYAEVTPGYENVWSDVLVTGFDSDETKDETTGVTAAIISSEPQDNIYYDLYGRKVLHPGKGIYIINGKKVLIK